MRLRAQPGGDAPHAAAPARVQGLTLQVLRGEEGMQVGEGLQVCARQEGDDQTHHAPRTVPHSLH